MDNVLYGSLSKLNTVKLRLLVKLSKEIFGIIKLAIVSKEL